MLLCGLGILLSLPNLTARPAFLPGFIPWNQVHLGLDLRGGQKLFHSADMATGLPGDGLRALRIRIGQTYQFSACGPR